MANQTAIKTVNCQNILTKVLGDFSPETLKWSLPEWRLPTLVKFGKDEVQVFVSKRGRVVVFSDLRSEIKGFRFESGCQLCAEVICLQQSPG